MRKFTIIHKLGFNPRLRCWCGGELELNYFSRESDAMTHKLNTFLDTHEDCQPQQQEEEAHP